MNGGISGPFIRHPIATSLLMAGLLFAGLIAYPQLPVAPLPQVDFPTIKVSATLPGASPTIMASTVAQPLETQFAQIPDISQMTSSSSVGSTAITIQFNLDRNIDAAANDVQAAINAAGGQLPKTLPSPPTYKKENPADSPVMLLAATSDSLPITDVDDQVNTKVAQQLSQISGVAQVDIGGQATPAVRVELDPDKLVAKGLSLEQVRAALSTATVNSPKGEINGATRSYTIYDNDQLTEAAAWNNIIIAYRNGAPLRVRDVGRAVSGPQDNTQEAWANGKRGIFLVIFKQPGANVISTIDQIKAELPKLEAALPPAIHVSVLSDRTQTIRASVHDVQITLLITISLVVMVIFVFLRNVWATIIPSVTVPLALLSACALMWAVGYSLDNLSLMALTIAVGFVVDDAIVVLENITRHIEEGQTPYRAALIGAGEIGFTILSISCSLIAVLIPLLLMGGIIGRLFREFAVTLAMTIGVSAVVSLTLTPTMAARFMRPANQVHHGRLYQASERAFQALIDGYEWALDKALAWRKVTLTIFIATLALTVYLFMIIPKGFFPQQDTGLIMGTSQAAQDVSPDDLAKHQEQLQAIVLKDPAVATVAASIGAGTNGSPANTGHFYITLKPRDERTASADQVIARLRPELDKVEGARLFLQAAQDIRVGGRASRSQYEYTLQDADLTELNAWSPKILAKLKTLSGLRDVASDEEDSGTTLTLTINRDQAARFGIQPQLIDDSLDDAFGQRQIAQYFTQLSTYYVIMEINPALRGTVESLNDIYITSPTTGGEVPISAFAHWSTVPVQPLAIAHQGQFPATTISFNLAPNVALGQATTAIAQAMAELKAPPSLQATFQGTAEAFQESLGTIPELILAAIVVVYLILGILYESYIHPLTILSTLPSAGVGAFMALILGGFDFSLIALIGLILLIGIVKKNGIMMVDFAIVGERDGLTPHDAIRRAALLRFRPIMMTTMAALLGALPLMLGHGTGAELRQPLGWTMVGGLMVSQALTLFTTPVIYLYLDGLSNLLRRTRPIDEDSGEDGERAETDETWPREAAAS